MAEDWDLSAVVRGCKSSSAAATATTNTPSSSCSSSKDPTLPLIKQENGIFSFPNLIQPTTNGFQELHQLFRPFIPTTTTISTSGCGIYPNSSFTDFAIAGSSSRSNNNNINSASSSSLAAVSAATSYSSSNIRPHFMPQSSPSSTSSPADLQRFHDQHVQQLQKQMQIQDQLQELVHQKPQFQIPPGQISGGGSKNSGMTTLPNTQPAQATTTRSRKRKNQQKRMVCHVTAQNLTSDSWAWRKYGQKPIKGSPYPRNYYRCSSSKGCGARKQVERSNTEPDMFIVTYTGEHTHPRPTHRNSLAGSTRNKPTTTETATTRQLASSHESMGSQSVTVNRASSSSQLSPTTPLTAVANDVQCADEHVVSNEATSPFHEEDDELDLASHDDDDDDVLIPNMVAMVDKFLLGGGEFHGGIGLSGGGGNNSNTSGKPAGGSCPNSEPG